MAPIEFDDAAWPLLNITMTGRPSDEQFRDYLVRYSGYLERERPYALIISTAQGMPISRPAHVKMQAEWMKEHREALARLCAGTAFVLPSPAMRGVLRAIVSLQKIPSPYEVFRTKTDGIAWAAAQLNVT